MLNELCQELNNWFDRNQIRLCGRFTIEGSKIIDEDFTSIIKENQYFRIIGSVFNDGVYKYSDDLTLVDEQFIGAVWLMALPNEIVDLDEEITAWMEKYNATINSPYSSESFGGYSYTKSSTSNDSWQSAFASRLNKWRKL